MSLPIKFEPIAQNELDNAIEWYEGQRPGLGIDLAIAVERVLTRVADQPDFYPPTVGGLREGLVRGFPYCVYYREEAGSIAVVAVIHNARDPKTWQRRS